MTSYMKLALNGGQPVRKSLLPYSKHQITNDDKKAVLAVLDSDWIAGNGYIGKQFEEALCDYTGYKYATLVNSATSGLYLAVELLCNDGLARIPALTFVATANVFALHNINIWINDVDKNTLTFDRSDIDLPDAPVGVSYAGYPILEATIADDAHYLYP